MTIEGGQPPKDFKELLRDAAKQQRAVHLIYQASGTITGLLALGYQVAFQVDYDQHQLVGVAVWIDSHHQEQTDHVRVRVVARVTDGRFNLGKAQERPKDLEDVQSEIDAFQDRWPQVVQMLRRQVVEQDPRILADEYPGPNLEDTTP